MLYTPGQIMCTLGLTKQQWRTYRKALHRLNSGPGHAPCFSAGQLLAARAAQFVAHRLQVPLTVLSPLSGQLFSACESAPWPQLERSKIAIDLSGNAVELLLVEQMPARVPIAVIIELRPLISGLREKLLEVDVDDQSSLAFPPMVAGSRQ
ncbi:MAG: hypothetical protein WD044_10400 [Dongiaceae bacterium]